MSAPARRRAPGEVLAAADQDVAGSPGTPTPRRRSRRRAGRSRRSTAGRSSRPAGPATKSGWPVAERFAPTSEHVRHARPRAAPEAAAPALAGGQAAGVDRRVAGVAARDAVREARRRPCVGVSGSCWPRRSFQDGAPPRGAEPLLERRQELRAAGLVAAAGAEAAADQPPRRRRCRASVHRRTGTPCAAVVRVDPGRRRTSTSARMRPAPAAPQLDCAGARLGRSAPGSSCALGEKRPRRVVRRARRAPRARPARGSAGAGARGPRR